MLGLIVLMTALAGACRTSPPTNTGTDPSAPGAKTESNSKVAEQPVEERSWFAGRIDNVSMYPVPNRHEDLAISLVVSVTNAGVSSLAQGWSLEVSSPNQAPVNLEPVHVNGVVEMPGRAGTKVDLGKEDLALKAAQAAIAKGGRVDGILTFVLTKSTESGLVNNNTRLVISFKDAQGHSYRTPAIIVGAKAGAKK